MVDKSREIGDQVPLSVRVDVLGVSLHREYFCKGSLGLLFTLDWDPSSGDGLEVYEDSRGFISVVKLPSLLSVVFENIIMAPFGISFVPDPVIEFEETADYQTFLCLARDLGAKTFLSPEQEQAG